MIFKSRVRDSVANVSSYHLFISHRATLVLNRPKRVVAKSPVFAG